MTASPDSVRSILFALGANFSIAVAKGFAAVYTGSGAMLAEAIHSVADTGNQLLLLLGIKQSRRPPNMEYPLGFGKSTRIAYGQGPGEPEQSDAASSGIADFKISGSLKGLLDLFSGSAEEKTP